MNQKYQLEYSAIDPSLFDVSSRQLKAKKNVAVLQDYLGPLDGLSLLDVSSSTGIMTQCYGNLFGHVVGIDIDRLGMQHANTECSASNIDYVMGDAMRLPLQSNSFDVASCTQVYEHVPDPHQMMEEILRILKPGGVCLFGATNRMNIIENHYGRLPFLSIIPKPLGHLYLRVLGRAKFYYETHYTLWGLRRLVRDFELIDYSGRIIDEPETFFATDMMRSGSAKQKIGQFLFRWVHWMLPGYVWILIKPSSQ